MLTAAQYRIRQRAQGRQQVLESLQAVQAVRGARRLRQVQLREATVEKAWKRVWTQPPISRLSGQDCLLQESGVCVPRLSISPC